VRGERPRYARPSRRRTDHLEDAGAWLLTALGLLVAVTALTTGVRLYAEGLQRMAVEDGDRTQTAAVLLEPAPAGVMAGRMNQPAGPLPVPVPAHYTTSDGVEHVADVWVLGPRPAGTPVPIWVDATGAVTTEPTRRADVVLDAAIRAAVVVGLGALVLGASWVLMRLGVRRANLARWEREWARVEPPWSGRTTA
jgi:hypothetical protein